MRVLSVMPGEHASGGDALVIFSVLSVTPGGHPLLASRCPRASLCPVTHGRHEFGGVAFEMRPCSPLTHGRHWGCSCCQRGHRWLAPRADRPELVTRLRAKGLTQKEIGATIGVTQRGVGKILNRTSSDDAAPATAVGGPVAPRSLVPCPTVCPSPSIRL